MLDASFSFDGVIGAFAITTDPILIALGLGLIGAMFVRSLTVFLVRKGTLADYVYLEHGAHWAIGALSVILLVGIGYHVNEFITGLIGVAFIGAAFLSSVLRNRKLAAEGVDTHRTARGDGALVLMDDARGGGWRRRRGCQEYLRQARTAVLGKLDGLLGVRGPQAAHADGHQPARVGQAPRRASRSGTSATRSGGRSRNRPRGCWATPRTTADPNIDLFAAADESRTQIVELYRRACAHADATIAALPLDASGRVPHWQAERATVTLHHVLVHVLADTTRHAGHADILRETVDGVAGLRAVGDNLPSTDPAFWAAHVARVEAAARAAAG